MGVFNTFYLLFKTNLGETRKELKGAQDDTKKLGEEVKKTNKETGVLGETFTSAYEAAAGALASYLSYQAIKTGIVNAAEYNRTLGIQTRLWGQNSTEIAVYSQAIKAAGGSLEELNGWYDQIFKKNASVGHGTQPVAELLRRIHNEVKGLDPKSAELVFQRFGITGQGTKNFLYQSDEQFDKQIQKFTELTNINKEATKTAEEFGAAIDTLGAATTKYFTALNNDLLPGLTKSVTALSNWVSSNASKGDLFPWWTYFEKQGTRVGQQWNKILGRGDANGVLPGHTGYDNGESTTSPSVHRSSNVPLGLRNNNPGNLRPGGQFAKYKTPEEGIAALGNNLRRYGRKGWNTLDSILGHWAPPNENDTEAYIRYAEKSTGFSRNQTLDLNDPAVLNKLASAIITHENGYNPYNNRQISRSLSAANNAMQIASDTPFAQRDAGASNSSSTNIKIDKIEVNTQATDAQGMATAAGEELKKHLWTAAAQKNDAVAY